MKISRRALIKLVALTASAKLGAVSNDPERFNSGYSEIDRGVQGILDFLTNLFRLDGDWTPDFRFFDDQGQPNAYASDPILGFRRPEIMIGRGTVSESIRVSSGEFGGALTGVFAHEFAHVFQLKGGIRNRLLIDDCMGSRRLVETHADFLAGWALPQAWWITKLDDLKVAAAQFYALGDMQFEAQGHHGTSLQRQSIMAAGYTWGLTSPHDPDKASEYGEAVLRDLFPQWFMTK